MGVLELTRQGLYCAAGGFYVDAWEPVERTVVTHAHGDHAYAGCGHYLTAAPGVGLLRLRVGEASVQGLAYGEQLRVGEVTLSLHPAGHILGSAQVRIEHRGEVWVVSGDYKLAADPTCAGFEPVRCHTFLTESTFGLPVYRWAAPDVVIGEISGWWAANRAAGKTSLLLCYALGKAQRVLAGVAEAGPIVVHGAVERVNLVYRAGGVKLAATTTVGEAARKQDWRGALVVAPPSAFGSPWTRRFNNLSSGFASGWMRVRGQRRRRALDRGFALSDHADWPALLTAVAATGAERVLVTHGSAGPLARFLGERGVRAEVLATKFVGEAAEELEAGGAGGDAETKDGEGRGSDEDGDAGRGSDEAGATRRVRGAGGEI
jgi:putative mRNA 3-end processing factor